jgi:hypothetical protein
VSEKASPLLAKAHRAAAYFDRRARDRNGGRWVSVIRVGSEVEIREHHSQYDAYAHIGVDAGSKDPAHHPPTGDTGVVISIGADAS